MRALVCLLIASAALAAPVPPGPPPDPLGKGYMGVKAMGENSLTISSTMPNSPASEAGLRSGDVFVRVGPLRPQSFDEVRDMIGSLRPGTRIRITVKRGGAETTTVLILANRPPNFGTIEVIDPQP